MAIVGVASIRVRPDLTEFRKELKAELASIKNAVTIKVDADVKDARAKIEAFVAAQQAKDITKNLKVNVDKNSAKQAEKEVSGVINALASAEKAVSGFGIGGNILGGALLALPNVLHTIIPLLTSAAGAALLIPGALVSAVGVFAAVKLGIDGIHHAFNGLNPTIKALGSQVSNSFQTSLTPAVNNLKKILPQLSVGFRTIATSIGGVATKITLMLKAGDNTKNLNSILSGTGRIIQNLGVALVPLIQAFLNVAKIGTDTFVQLSSHIGGAAQRLAAFTGSSAGIKDIHDRILLAVAAFKTLGDIIHTLGSIIGGVFSGLAQGGGSVGGSLVQTLHSISDAIHSIKGQQALAALGTALAAVGHAVAQTLGPALQALFPILTVVFGFIADHANIFGPLIVGLVGMKLASPLAASGIKLVSGALELLSASPLLLVVAAIAGLIIATGNAQPVINALKRAWESILPALRELGNAVLPPLKRLWEDLKPAMKGVADIIGKVFDVLTPVAELLLKLATFIIPLVIKFLDLLLIPINAVIKALDFLSNLSFTQLIANFSTLLTALSKTGAVTGLVDHLQSQLDAHSKGFLKPFTDVVNEGLFSLGKGPEASAAGKRIVDSLTFGMSSAGPRIHDFFAGTLTGIVGFINGNLGKFQDPGKGIVDAIQGGMFLENVRVQEQTVSKILDSVIGVFQKHSGDFAQVGQDIASRLSDGMTLAQQAAVDAGVNLMGKVFFGITSQSLQSTQFGINFVQLFNQGISSQQQAAINAGINTVGSVFFGLHTRDGEFLPFGINVITLFNSGMTLAQQALFQKASDIITGVVNQLKGRNGDVFAAGAEKGTSFASGITSRAIDAYRAGDAVAANLPPHFGTSLFGVGQVIMDSLINGIQSKKNFLQQVLGGITALIPLSKGPPSKDKVLLKPAGEAIMDGLINSILGKQLELQAALASVTGTISSAFDPNASAFNPAISAQLGASLVSSNTIAPAPVVVNVNTDTPALKDFISVQIDDGNRDTRRRVLAGG